MNTVKRIMLIMGFLLVYFTANAQKDLDIGAIFDEYGKQEGSILIELGKDVLGNHTQIKRYKSLIIPSDTAIIRITKEAIANDIKGGGTLFETRKDGEITSASYYLKNVNTTEFEYILFSNKSRKMTLIYVRGNFPPGKLESELLRLKDLFIKVNNKLLLFGKKSKYGITH